MTNEITLTTPPMPPEEALEIFRGMVFGKQSFDRFRKKEREAISRAMYVFEKQIPKSAKYDMDDDYVECPSCGACTTANSYVEDIRFCFKCGQALKVGEEE